MRVCVFVLLSLLSSSCLRKNAAPSDSDAFMPSRRLAELNHKELDEVSGIASSIVNPGMLWTHNDSGNPAVVYLIDHALNIKLACKLEGVKNRDWEDIAVGSGPVKGKSYVYVGDIGDNNAKHEFKIIYRFEEPSAADNTGQIVISKFDKIVFRLADQKKDTETLLVHPENGNIYVVSKREQPVVMYELKAPVNAGDTLTAQPIVSIPITQAVGGDFSPDGKELLLKNYENIYYWRIGQRSLVEALKEKPGILTYTEEPQGEAIAFDPEGSAFYTLSEKIKGEKTYLYVYERNLQARQTR